MSPSGIKLCQKRFYLFRLIFVPSLCRLESLLVLPHALQLGAECAAASECDGAPDRSVGADEARQQLGAARLGEVSLCAACSRLRARLAQVDLGKVSCVS